MRLLNIHLCQPCKHKHLGLHSYCPITDARRFCTHIVTHMINSTDTDFFIRTVTSQCSCILITKLEVLFWFGFILVNLKNIFSILKKISTITLTSSHSKLMNEQDLHLACHSLKGLCSPTVIPDKRSKTFQSPGRNVFPCDLIWPCYACVIFPLNSLIWK